MTDRTHAVRCQLLPLAGFRSPFTRRVRLVAFVVLALFLGMTERETVAAVDSDGSVDPVPPINGGTSNATLSIGTDNGPDDFPLGTVAVTGTTTLAYNRVIVGETVGFFGELEVTGGTLEVDDASESQQALQVGDVGTGTLTVTAGGVVNVFDSGQANGDVVIGRSATGFGHAVIDGPTSQLVIGERLLVGDNGVGRLDITNQAKVLFTDPNDVDVTVGRGATGVGVVKVDGLGTIWQIPENLVVGGAGSGDLQIADQAVVIAGNTTVVGTRGRIGLSDGSFVGQGMTLSGVLTGSGVVTGGLGVTATGEAVASAGEVLRLNGTVTNAGVIAATGGEIELLGAVTNSAASGSNAPGRISASDGTVRFYDPLTNAGVLASAFGVNQFFGDITNAATGSIVVAGESGATFHGPVDVGPGSLTVFEGSTAVVLDDVDFGSGSLVLQIGGDDDLTSIAQLDIAGTAALSGTLDIDLVSGASPVLGDSYQVLSAAGGVTGTFTTESLPALDTGLEWSVDYQANAVVLDVIADPGSGGTGAGAADLDLDNDVDVADLLFWQRVDGTTFGRNAWETGFGTGDAVTGVAATAVPEPGTLLLALTALLPALRRGSS
ncbi:MAG: hypothetical protein AAGA92_09035 [Planctomycetota bacterium]